MRTVEGSAAGKYVVDEAIGRRDAGKEATKAAHLKGVFSAAGVVWVCSGEASRESNFRTAGL